MHVDKPKSFWENVLWMDETKLELFGKSPTVLFTEDKIKLSKKRIPCLP